MKRARDEAKLAEQFGVRLLELREERGLSVRAAAKLIGIDHTRLLSFEQGKERTTGRPTLPSPMQVSRIASAYHYSKELLLAEAGYIPWHLTKVQTEHLLSLAEKQLSEESSL